MRDYQTHTDGRTDRCRTKWSLCADMLRRRHKNRFFQIIPLTIMWFSCLNFIVRYNSCDYVLIEKIFPVHNKSISKDIDTVSLLVSWKGFLNMFLRGYNELCLRPPITFSYHNFYDMPGLAPHLTVLFWRKRDFSISFIKQWYTMKYLKTPIRKIYGR